MHRWQPCGSSSSIPSLPAGAAVTPVMLHWAAAGRPPALLPTTPPPPRLEVRRAVTSGTRCMPHQLGDAPACSPHPHHHQEAPWTQAADCKQGMQLTVLRSSRDGSRSYRRPSRVCQWGVSAVPCCKLWGQAGWVHAWPQARAGNSQPGRPQFGCEARGQGPRTRAPGSGRDARQPKLSRTLQRAHAGESRGACAPSSCTPPCCPGLR